MATYKATTHKMIGSREFDLMKPSAFFVNTARGRIVDEPALVEALRKKKIAGAGLDVYWHEPPVGEPRPSAELFDLPNAILTPHIGSATVEAREDGARGGRQPPDHDPGRPSARHLQPLGVRGGPTRSSDRLG
jgi:phosphoglycerate dehydrogenase-like enzyme